VREGLLVALDARLGERERALVSRLCVSVFIMSVFSLTWSSLLSRSASRSCVSMLTRFKSLISSDALACFDSCASSL
jgi:hypothetical protein